MPSSSNGSFVQDTPAYILPSDGATVKQFTTADNTQTLTNKTLTSPTINTPTVSNGTFTTPAITNPKIQLTTRAQVSYPPVLTMYASPVGAQQSGYIDLTTGASTGDDAYIAVVDSSSTGGFIRGDRAFEATFLVNIAQTATTEFEIGFSDDASPTALMVNTDTHISIVYDASTSANWIQRNANGASQTSTTSSTAVTTGVHAFTILNTESSISFYVDGTLLATAHTTNIPTTTTMGFFCHVQTETTAAKTAYYIGGTVYTDVT